MPAVTDGLKPDDHAERDGAGFFAEIELAPAGAFASVVWSVAAMLAVAWPGSAAGGRASALILTAVAALILIASSLGGPFPGLGRLVHRSAPWLAGLGLLAGLWVALG